jgi:hypothetical protein
MNKLTHLLSLIETTNIQKAMEIQDEVVDYVKEVAEYAGVELEFENSDYDGNILFLTFSPTDLITMGEYNGDTLTNDIRKHALKNRYQVLYTEEDDTFQIEIHGVKKLTKEDQPFSIIAVEKYKGVTEEEDSPAYKEFLRLNAWAKNYEREYANGPYGEPHKDSPGYEHYAQVKEVLAGLRKHLAKERKDAKGKKK